MPSSSKTPRVIRQHDPDESFTDATYRKKSFPKLMEDFDERCAYSLVHVEEIGKLNMEVDHFNPTLKGKKRHSYRNLYPATSVCNRAKSHVWPTTKDIQKRRRYLDCCKETEYGVHLFEDRTTGELLPVTPEGVYHVENCDLNNDWLKRKRRERSEDATILAALKSGAASPLGPGKRKSEEAIAIIGSRVERGIPIISKLPVEMTAF